jgi:hypothetical protein
MPQTEPASPFFFFPNRPVDVTLPGSQSLLSKEFDPDTIRSSVVPRNE